MPLPLKLKCEVCEEIIATTDTDRLAVPIMSTMFGPKEAGYPDLWSISVSWEYMTCPHCGWRPFVMTEKEIQDALEGKTQGPNWISTPQGRYLIGSNRLPGPEQQFEVPTFTDEDLEREWNARANPPQFIESMPVSDFRPKVKRKYTRRTA